MSNWTSWWSGGGKSTRQCRGHGFNFWSQEDPSSLEATKPQPELLMLKCPRAQCSVEKGATTMGSPLTTTKEQPLRAATTESAHSNKDPGLPKIYTVKRNEDRAIFWQSEMLFTCLRDKKNNCKKVSFVDLCISYYLVNYRFTRMPGLLCCIYNLTNFKSMILRL